MAKFVPRNPLVALGGDIATALAQGMCWILCTLLVLNWLHMASIERPVLVVVFVLGAVLGFVATCIRIKITGEKKQWEEINDMLGPVA